jgi:hypothetical protein
VRVCCLACPLFHSQCLTIEPLRTTDSMLRTSLPDKVFEKFSQALSRDALSAAAVEGLVTCHHCSMQMLMEPDAGM